VNLTRRILEGIHEVELEITPEFQKGPIEPVGPTGPTWGVPLSDAAKLVLVNRPWMHVTHPNADVTESNSVMVLTKSLPFEVSEESKKKIVQGAFKDIEFQTFWAEKLQAWRIWPNEGQDPDEFNANIAYLVNHIDDVIDAAEEEAVT
jgi:hypothetical protein